MLHVKSQTREFDKLEQLYAQGHYKMVHRKAKRYLKKQKFAYSFVPSYYVAISKIQLCMDDYWLNRNSGALNEIQNRIKEIKNHPNGEKFLLAHKFEIAGINKDLLNWYSSSSSIKKIGVKTKGTLDLIMENLTMGICLPEISKPIKPIDNLDKTHKHLEKNRRLIIKEAKKHLGTPYVWGGTSPKGFDCSGFTQFVYDKKGIKIPRISKDQYENSKKVKEKNIKVGDLVFFSNNSKISHVGIIYSNDKNKLEMIHASSSKGIIITNFKDSKYWSSRLKGYGRILD